MAELLWEHATRVRTPEGETFIATSWAEQQLDGTWIGWLEFAPADGAAPLLVTDRETTQPNRHAAVYWATGLEPVYLQGAFERARPALHR